jgi:ATP-binding cassette, subfamily C, bacterial CydD
MQDAKTAARAWARQQTRQGWRPALPVIALGAAGIVAAVAQAFCLADWLAALLTHARAHWWTLVAFAALALARAGLQFLADQRAFRAGAIGRARLRADIVARLLAAGPALLRGHHSAELASAAVDQVEAMDGLYGRWIPAAALAIAGPLLVATAAGLADPAAALILAAAGVLVPVGQAVAGIGAAAASRGQFLALARLQARFLDRIRGIATIVLAGRAEDEALALAEAADELRIRTMRVLRVVFLSSAMLDCAMAAALIGLALRYRHLLAAAATGHIASNPQTALFVMLLVPEFFAPLRGFAAAYQDRMHATGAAEALVGLPQLPAAPAAALAIRTVSAHGVSIAFQNVHLTWDTSRGPALDGLSFVVPAGEMLLLAGPSGSGKSTVIELLLGFVRPDKGRILINGADIADIVPQALSQLTAWIGQKPTLFASTILDNIRFARPEASDAEVAEAARQASVTDFAAALPQGLNTPIGEGGHGISGGQAQRVAIARAFLKNAPLLLLDEPTSHLDPATEAEVLASLRRLAVGRTVIMAAHSAAAHAFGGRRLDLRDGRALPARGVA